MNLNAWSANGIDGSSGSYFGAPLEPIRLTRHLLDSEAFCRPNARMPLSRVDPDNLSETGWAVVFPDRPSSEIHRALEPLLGMRRQEVGESSTKLYKELVYYPGENKNHFLSHQIAQYQ